MLDLVTLQNAQSIVSQALSPTPQLAWPLLAQACGCEVWVKHENHTPIGAFKVRGGVVYLHRLNQSRPDFEGIISATRGNHGQSLAYAAGRLGKRCVLVVPHSNSKEKNAAMQALGAELIEHGQDFDEARQEAERLATHRDLTLVPSFHEDLVAGVATYGLELMGAVDDLDALYVPIGLGSGICGAISARNGLGRKTEIIGVVSAHADAYAKSFETGQLIETNSALTFADGMAVRVPHPDALAGIRAGAERIVRVNEEQLAAAVRLYFRATHNVAEGAGAAPLAALMSERQRQAGRKVGLVLSGQNIDTDWFCIILNGALPTP